MLSSQWVSAGGYFILLFVLIGFFSEVLSVTPPVLLKVIHVSHLQVQLANEISLKHIKPLSVIALKATMKPSGECTGERENVPRKFIGKKGNSLERSYCNLA